FLVYRPSTTLQVQAGKWLARPGEASVAFPSCSGPGALSPRRLSVLTACGAQETQGGELMAARSIWKGAISFGMVSIPVSLFTASQSKDLSFNMLHKECHSRIKQVRRCPVDEVDLETSDIVK